ncbi:MAG: DNA polymerase ligase N-terminal domain-containing protein [Longimicrobiales bacterium]
MAIPRDDRLRTYREKRRASRTPEPFGGDVPVGGSIFVVQKHDARALHWDLRLELDGVLLSWAVPKGPSPNQDDKRLAMQTEDHPLEYAEFEGVIPEGEYGAGPMIVWDRGVWVPLEDPHQGLEKGKLLFELRGHKLLGRWTLVKTRQSENSWLLIKERDGYMDPSKSTEDYPDDSIYSGLTVSEFARADERAVPWPRNWIRRAPRPVWSGRRTCPSCWPRRARRRSAARGGSSS